MNLFFFSWRLRDEHVTRVLDALVRMSELYPQLDPATIWHYKVGREVFAASIHTAELAAVPRRYVFRDEDQITFYDGLMVDRAGRFAAHRADELSTNWDQLTASLEGRFVVVRAGGSPPSIELLTDPLGMEQVYYLRRGDAWLVSNSISLLEQVGAAKDLDPLGVSLFLTIDWVAADRTLLQDIRVFPGGHRLTWGRDVISPTYEAYFPRSGLAKKARRMLTARKSARLAEDLIQICGSLGRDFGELNCPLSAGKDTRVMASLLLHGSIPAKYWTDGDPSSTDVLMAEQIARTLGLKYHINKPPTSEVTHRWDDLIQPLVLRTGGLISLVMLGNLPEQPPKVERLEVMLAGFGGEIARSFYGDYYFFTHGFTGKRMIDLFGRQLFRDHHGLIEPEATDLAWSYVRDFLEGCLDEGFDPLDVPDVFYSYERVRRWASNLCWERAPTEDYFSPFCSRPFIEAAFSMSALQRYAEPIHYRLIRDLEPKLFSLPMDKPWRSQRPSTLQVMRYAQKWAWEKAIRRIRFLERLDRADAGIPDPVPMSDPATWIEAKREQIREVCLSQSDSMLWNFLNRSLFEQLMSRNTDSSERRRSMRLLFTIATMFYYEMLRTESKPS